MKPPARKRSRPDFPDLLSGSEDDEGELASDQVVVSARSLQIPARKFLDNDEEELEVELTKDSNAPKAENKVEEECCPDSMVEEARTAAGCKKSKGMQAAEVQEEDEKSDRKSTKTSSGESKSSRTRSSGEQVRLGNVCPGHSLVCR